MRLFLQGLAGLVVLVIVAYLGGAWLLQRRVMFPRPPAAPADHFHDRPGVESFRADGDTGVDAWLLRPHRSAGRFPVLLFAHGNGELVEYWRDEFEPLRAAGLGVLLVEYPGYGRSPGEPGERSITRAFVETYDRLVSHPDVDPQRIVGYGRSLGGGAIGRLGRERELAAVVFESTFTGVRPLARGLGVPGWLVRDPFDNLEFVSGYDGPILLLHGNRDPIIPIGHAEALEGAARNARLVRLECGHNDCPRAWDELLEFLDAAGLLPATAENVR